jgi:hypothetical protein
MSKYQNKIKETTEITKKTSKETEYTFFRISTNSIVYWIIKIVGSVSIVILSALMTLRIVNFAGDYLASVYLLGITSPDILSMPTFSIMLFYIILYVFVWVIVIMTKKSKIKHTIETRTVSK